jgi:hypothetical protein
MVSRYNRRLLTAPSSRILCLCLAVTVIAAPARAADEEDAPAATPPSAQTDVGDLWRKLRDKEPAAEDQRSKVVIVTPSIGSKPSTGLNAGVAGHVAFFLGDPDTTHISTLVGGLKVSTKKQALGNIRFATFSDHDRWFFQGDNRLSRTSQDTYGIGGDTLATDAENMKFNLRRFYETAYRSVKAGLFVGVGLNVSHYSDVRPGTGAQTTWGQSEYVTYNLNHGFAVEQQTSSGTSIGLIYDTRDNAINPQRGVLASASYRTFYEGFLGGDSTWQGLYVDARTYKTLTKDARHKLAFWFLGDLVTGGTAPYMDLPSTAVDERSARGYGEGRYRGEHLLYGEVEYRGALTSSGLVGIVAFLNTSTVDNTESGQRLFESFAPGVGFGFRILLNKRSKTNLCSDFGWGKNGSRGFYLAIQDTF